MSSVTTTWSPNSYQLQFSLRFRKSPTTALFLRNRVGRFDRCRFRVLCVANDGIEKKNVTQLERGQNGGSWSTECLSDWFGSSVEPDESKRKKGFPGIVGAGLAGVLLFGGLTFAALSIGKQSASRPKQEMEPLTQQQEALLPSVEDDRRIEETNKDGQDVIQDVKNLQNDNHLESQDAGMSVESIANIDESGPDDASLRLSNEPLDSSTIASEIPIQADSVDNYELNDAVAPDVSAIASETVLEDIDNPSEPYWRTESESVSGSPEEKLGSVAIDTSLSSSDANLLEEITDGVILESSPSNDSQVQETDGSLHSQPYELSESQTPKYDEVSVVSQNVEDIKSSEAIDASKKGNSSTSGAFEVFKMDRSDIATQDDTKDVKPIPEYQAPGTFSPAGIPAPSLLSAASQTSPGKVLVPTVVDQAQWQALSALQVLKVIEADAQPSELCTRREYARWLVSASSAVSRNSTSKVYPAMYIENITDLAFDDITPEDPDFSYIQGLAEAGLIASKLSKRDMLSSPDEDVGSFKFFPDSPLSRQDLVTWKIALEKRLLPTADRKILHQQSGFIDIDRIDPEAWPALVADISAGDQGITALAFGYTRLFQPYKPVTKSQAAIALATGDAAYMVSEELTRIEAESMAEKAVSAHSALVAEVEKDVNASFEKELLVEREKIDAMEKMAEEAKKELETLRAERELENVALMKERAAIESEMEVLSKLRHQVEEQLESLMSKKVEVSYEKERIEKLRKATEDDNQAVVRLQYELEIERKALSMARAWAEDEAKRVRDQAKVLEEARDRWEKRGIKIVVDKDLREQASEETTWLNVEKQVQGTAGRADSLVEKLNRMAAEVTGKSKAVINMIIEMVKSLILVLKEWTFAAGRQTMEFKDTATEKAGESLQDLRQSSVGFTVAVKEGAKRVAGDCREGVEKLTQKFKA